MEFRSRQRDLDECYCHGQTLTPQQAPQMTLVAAVAVTRAIEELTGIEPSIKWPNDILVDGKKVTGILTELQADPDQVKAVILRDWYECQSRTRRFS